MSLFSLDGGASSVVQGILLGFPALFSITDPIGNAVIFSQMTGDRSVAERRLMADRVGLYTPLFLLAALWAGSPVLQFFGVTLAALKIAGGLVVAATGWHLLYEADHGDAAGAAADKPAQSTARPAAADFAFFPLTMPLVVGPGAISVSITLGAARPGASLDLLFMLGVSIAALIVSAMIALLFRYAGLLARWLGPRGSAAVRRIVALLLIAIGVQIMAIGLQDTLVPFLHGAMLHGPGALPGSHAAHGSRATH
jgi:multiple antibiotic resistance protein